MNKEDIVFVYRNKKTDKILVVGMDAGECFSHDSGYEHVSTLNIVDYIKHTITDREQAVLNLKEIDEKQCSIKVWDSVVNALEFLE